MKTFFILLGGTLCAAGIYLLYQGIRLTEANMATGVFSVRVWEAVFWLKRPPLIELGLSDNALALLELLGGSVLSLVGYRFLRAGDRMAAD